MEKYKDKKVAILGWGINGLDTARYLLKSGAFLTILDEKEKENLDFSDFDVSGVKLSLGRKYLSKGLTEYDIVFRTPGVYRFLPEILEAEKRGVVITSVVKEFFKLCPSKIIGVTGTKGKGTTATLIHEILKKDGKDVYLAGNIGIPMLDLIQKLKPSSWVVLELSSFQLIDLTVSPHISVVLNITQDHMDWHKDRNEYLQAKSHIVRYQKANDFAVLAYDYKDSGNFSRLTPGEAYYFSNSQKVPRGSFVEDNNIVLYIKRKKVQIGKTKKLFLKGIHNWENVCAAVCATYLADANIDSIKKTVFSFEGLEHRLEPVGEIKGVKFYNDSFSTNPKTSVAAIHSFEESLTLILGGSDKGLNYDEMGKEIANAKNVKNIVLIGEITNTIKKSLKKAKFKGKLIEMGKEEMKTIVRNCFDISLKGEVVLLSPATASFDMFKDYKDRGNQFKKALQSLKEDFTRKVTS